MRISLRYQDVMLKPRIDNDLISHWLWWCINVMMNKPNSHHYDKFQWLQEQCWKSYLMITPDYILIPCKTCIMMTIIYHLSSERRMMYLQIGISKYESQPYWNYAMREKHEDVYQVFQSTPVLNTLSSLSPWTLGIERKKKRKRKR